MYFKFVLISKNTEVKGSFESLDKNLNFFSFVGICILFFYKSQVRMIIFTISLIIIKYK